MGGTKGVESLKKCKGRKKANCSRNKNSREDRKRLLENTDAGKTDSQTAGSSEGIGASRNWGWAFSLYFGVALYAKSARPTRKDHKMVKGVNPTRDKATKGRWSGGFSTAKRDEGTFFSTGLPLCRRWPNAGEIKKGRFETPKARCHQLAKSVTSRRRTSSRRT